MEETSNGASLADRLADHVQQLAGEIGSRHVFRPTALARAADYIRRVWAAQGFAVGEQGYLVDGVDCVNLEVEIAGSETQEGMLLVGAHYDSVFGSPGADDNASGVAVLLELSRLLRDARLRRSVRLVAFTNEEPPFFMTEQQGSMVYAARARARGDKIDLMISLEMLGVYRNRPGSQRYPPLLSTVFPDRADFVAFVSDLRCRRKTAGFVAAFKDGCDFPARSLATFFWVPGIGWSDHRSFRRYGFPSMMITDTGFYRNGHYHRETDAPDTLDYASMARVTQGVAAGLRAMSAK